MKSIYLAAVAALIPFAAAAHDGVEVQDAYARSANPVTGAAFMVLSNHVDRDCRLSGVSSDVAERVELHTHREVDGVMKMTEVEEGFPIPANGTHELARGGDHVMFLGLKSPLEDGQTIPLTLDFGDCGTEQVEVPVDNQRTPEHGKAMHKMGDMEQADH
jgi:copper(I)-binding protein